MTKIKGAVLFVVALAVAMLALPGGVALAQQAPDHHKCYNIAGPMLPAPINVVLKDQFGTVEGTVQNLIMFSPPVTKQLPTGGVSPIMNPEDHLTWYDFEGGTTQQRDLLITNQFGTDLEWKIGNPRFLLLPAWKMYVNGEPTGLDHPSGLDHYLCYEALSGPPVGLDGVILTDQFHQEQVTVGDPMLLCNPVEKTVMPGGEVFPIIDPNNHLACYDIIPHEPAPPLDVVANDQFGDSQFVVLENQYLCVPSGKKIKPDDPDPGPCSGTP